MTTRPAAGRHAWTVAAIGAVLGLIALGAVAVASPAAARQAGTASGAHCAKGQLTGPARVGRIGGILRPAVVSCANSKIGKGDPAGGSPPLVYHGGRVMSVPSVGNKVVMTPIFWEPAGHTFTTGYKNLIVRYLQDVAAASNTDNIFATNTEYNGTDGVVHYGLQVGATIDDTNTYPASGCTVNTGSVYSDGSGYDVCLDDAQIIAETANETGALPQDLGHMYLMFTPKHVESCFQPGNPSGQQCSINPTPSAAYCAYHSAFGTGGNSIYGMMPFPVYGSATGFTCSSEFTLGTSESPNGNVDADVEISPLSHEMSEAITDPDLNAWFDSTGFENGDECAYTYGTTHGTAGALYNQTINGHHYLTQEEFSNNDFFLTGGGCLQGEPRPSITTSSPKSGTHNGGTLVTITGKYFLRASKVFFGTKAGTHLKYVSGTKLTVRTPSHAAGKVSVFVQTIGGKSAAKSTVTFTFN